MVTSSSQSQPDTFIVQIPKDQIYRVPPPENSKIPDRHRKPANKSSGNIKRCLFWFLCLLLLKALLATIIFCVHRFTLSPKPPTFSIKSVNASLEHVPGSRKAGFGFRVEVEMTNPNNVNDIGIQEGDVGFVYKGKMIGKGSLREVNLGETKRSDEVEVVVRGEGGLPKELKNEKKAQKFEVDINVGVKMKTWLFCKKRDIKVVCKVEVESIRQHSRILSEQCA